MNAAVSLKVNEKNLVRHLRLAFANKETVLSELMQNARRAGASYVSIAFDKEQRMLVVEDDGCGLADPQVILSIAESGWDNEIMESETPYGIGFLSAIFAAKHIRIESQGRRIEFDTESVLNFDSIPVTESARNNGMKIYLTGIEFDPESAVKKFAMGFPIGVFYNGEEMERPHAINGPLLFEESEEGYFHIPGLHEPIEKTRQAGGKCVIAYLQGVVIYRSTALRGLDNIVHLDPRKYHGRLPDRDKLVNEYDAINSIDSVIQNYWGKRLEDDVEAMPGETIASNYYPALHNWNRLDLLNKVDYLPSEVLACKDIYPICRNNWEEGSSSVTKVYRREEISNGDIVIALVEDEEMDPSSDEGFNVAMYVFLHEAHYLDHRLDEGHWIYGLCTSIERDDIEVVVHGKALEAVYSEGWIWHANVVFCDSVTMNGPLGSVTNDSHAFVYQNGFIREDRYPLPCYENRSLVIIPAKEDTGDVVRQLSDYIDENETFREDSMGDDSRKFVSFILANRPDNECHLMTRLLQEVSATRYDCLLGKAFSVEFSEDTGLKVEMVKRPKESREYTVVCLYPNHATGDFGRDIYVGTGVGNDAYEAARAVQEQAAETNDHKILAEDFRVIAVFAGNVEMELNALDF